MGTAKELESKVWSAANLMRSAGLNTLQYIEQLTDLLYLKIMDDKERDKEAEYEFLGKKGEYKTRLGREEYRFYNWAENEIDKVRFLDNLYNYLRDIPNNYGYDNSGIRRIFKRSNLLIRDNSVLERVVQIVKDIDLNEYDFDVKGRIYEFLLSKLQTEAGQLGQYFTPRHIVDVMIEIVNPQIKERIYDPACGTGGFLTRAFTYVQNQILEKCPGDNEAWDFLRNEQFVGRDISETTVKLCVMNMMLHGDGHTQILQGDSLSYGANQEDQLGKYDVVLTNPPFGSTTVVTDDLYKFPVRSKNPENLFLQHVMLSLKDGGRACVVVPEGILFRSADKRLRKYLLENFRLDAVISLPQGVFMPYTAVKTDLLFFTKGESTKEVWFYEVQNDGFELGAQRRPISGSQIPDLLNKIKNKEESNNSWNADIDKIKNNDYNLTASRYKKVNFRTNYKTVCLKDYIIPKGKKVNPQKEPEKNFVILGVTNKEGIIINEYKKGAEIKQKYKKVECGDLVYNPYRINVGSIGIATEEHHGHLISPAYEVFTTKTEELIPEFLFYLLKSEFGINAIKENTQGSVRMTLSLKSMGNIQIPLPSIEVQKIYLDRIKKQISLIKKSEEMINQIITTGIDESIFKNLDCEVVSLGEVCEFSPGSQPPASTFIREPKEGYVRLIQIRDYKTDEYITYIPESSKNKYCDETDVMIGRYGPPVFQILRGLKGAYNVALIKTIPDENRLLKDYLYYFLKRNDIQEYIIGLSTRARQSGVNQQDLKNLQIPLPSLEIQQQVVDRLKKQEEALNAVKKIKAEAEQIMQDIINELFG